MKIAMLCGKNDSTNIVFNYLSSKLDIGLIIVEDAADKESFLKRRVKKLGAFRVFGQILFILLIRPFLYKFAAKRIQEIYLRYSLDLSDDYLSSERYRRVTSVNSIETIQYLHNYAPDIVVVNGARIISEKVLSSCGAKFINMHAGITPTYRGVHGAYWALYNNDAANCGVTVHFVDSGIDTGGILYQARIFPTAKDNFVTYPLLQIAAGLELELQAIKDIENAAVNVITNKLSSKLYSHPTLFQYLYGVLFKKIK